MDTMQTQLDTSQQVTKVPETVDDARPTNVAFSVLAETQRRTYDKDQIIVFDAELTNQGNCFDIDTGIFTAQIAGTYFFQVHILTDNGVEVWGYIAVNDEKKAWFNAHASATDNRHGAGSQSAIFSLNKGDTVTVRNYADGAKYYGGNYSSFSGYMLFKNSV